MTGPSRVDRCTARIAEALPNFTEKSLPVARTSVTSKRDFREEENFFITQDRGSRRPVINLPIVKSGERKQKKETEESGGKNKINVSRGK